MHKSKKVRDICLRSAAFISASAAFILSIINIPGPGRAVHFIHALLWLYAFVTAAIKLFERALPATQNIKQPRTSTRAILLSILAWVALLTAGYSVFMLLPFRNYSLLVMAVAFLGLVELVFINAWCPFARLLTRARCCNSCRIRDWGEAMVLSPLIAMPSWWSAALIVLALSIIIKNEILYKKYPQLNPQNLSCVGCATQCSARNRQEPEPETITQ